MLGHSTTSVSLKMLSDYQLPVLKKFLSFFVLIVNIFGLWPFKFISSDRHHIEYSCLKAFYSAFALSFGMSTYWIIGQQTFHIIRKQRFNSFTLKFATSMHGYAILVIFLFVYIVPHIYRRKIEITFTKCSKIFDTMNEFFSHKRFNIWSYLLQIFLKVVVLEIFVASLSLQIYSSFSDILHTKFIVLLLLPPIAVRLHINVFYGTLLMFSVYYKKLNESLHDVVDEVNNIEPLSNLNDRLDAIHLMYFRLTEATKSLNEIFSITITLGHALILIALTIQSLLLFVAFIAIVEQGTDFFVSHTVFGILFIFISFYDLYATTYAAERLLNEVSKSIF